MSGISLTRFSILIIALCVQFLPSISAAMERHALVIGNSQYHGGFTLANPQNDTTAIAASLTSLGYRLHGNSAQLDLQLDQFNQTLNDFLASIENGSSTIIYYAGHGAASGGANYLIPILPEGVFLKSDSDIRDRSISIHSILDRLERKNPTGVNVVFFDACRDAPVDNYSRNLNLTGLTPLDTGRQPRGSFVGFSTEYGDVALDDNESGYSPFASAVLTSLDVNASAPIELFYKSVVDQVYSATNGQQFPIQESKIRGFFCLIECDAISQQQAPREFGQLIVNTSPLDAEVCYLIDGWTSPNCGPQIVLPINKDVRITVEAKGHKSYFTVTRLTTAQQQLRVTLEKNTNRTYKIVGGVAAAILAGVLLFGDSGSTELDSTHTVTLTRPNE